MTRHWAVSVNVDGRNIITIESNSLSGILDAGLYADEIRHCAMNLLGFIGESNSDTTAALAASEARAERAERERDAYHAFAAMVLAESTLTEHFVEWTPEAVVRHVTGGAIGGRRDLWTPRQIETFERCLIVAAALNAPAPAADTPATGEVGG